MSHPTIENRPMPWLGRAMWKAGVWPARILGRLAFDMRIERQAPLPEPPFVLAANHFSHFDPPIIGAAIGKEIRYLALDELFGISGFFDWLITTFGVIPVSRHRVPLGTIRVALKRLELGEIVGVFPEATRVAKWGDLPPKRGAAWLAIRADVPLVPVALLGTGDVFGLDNRLHRAPINVIVGRELAHRQNPTTLTSRWADWISNQIDR